MNEQLMIRLEVWFEARVDKSVIRLFPLECGRKDEFAPSRKEGEKKVEVGLC